MRLFKTFLVLVCLLNLTTQTALNYQKRCVYYDERQNVCNYDWGDTIRFVLQLDGHIRYSTQWAQAGCKANAYYRWNGLIVTDIWQMSEYNEDQELVTMIYFKQEVIRSYRFDRRPFKMILKSYIDPEAIHTIDLEPYKCQIVGNGKVQHFGVGIKDFPPCTFYLKCRKIWADKTP